MEEHVLECDTTAIEANVQKNLNIFCNKLMEHLDVWKDTLKATAIPLRGLLNLSVQARHVLKADISEDDARIASRDDALFPITQRIEEEILVLKTHLHMLNKANSDIKNRFIVLEYSTYALDWDQELPLIRGTFTHSELGKLLRMGLKYCDYFGKLSKRIGFELKTIDYADEKKMKELQKVFEVDLGEDNEICHLLTITQYVDNTKAII